MGTTSLSPNPPNNQHGKYEVVSNLPLFIRLRDVRRAGRKWLAALIADAEAPPWHTTAEPGGERGGLFRSRHHHCLVRKGISS